MGDNQYWATKTSDELCSHIIDQVNGYYNDCHSSGRWRLWRQTYQNYYGLSVAGTEHEASVVTEFGDSGELLSVKVNQIRSLIRHLVTMATANRPGFSPRAVNNDHASMIQVPLTRNVLEYYVRRLQLDLLFANALEASLLFGEAYAWITWDTAAGQMTAEEPIVSQQDEVGEDGETVFAGTPMLDPKTDEPVMKRTYEGDVLAQYKTPLDVIVPRSRDAGSPVWVIVRQFVNRHDYAARYPEHADDLATVQCPEEDFGFSFARWDVRRDADEIPVYHWYHRRSDAIPRGRYTIVAARGIVLFDGDLPYSDIPVYRVAPSEMLGAGIGYADSWDWLALNDVRNSVISNLVTVSDAFGTPNVAVVKGSEIEPANIMGGMNIIEYAQGTAPPQILQMPQIQPGAFELINLMSSDMQALSGLNATSRGQPESNIKSGTMAALMQSMATQYNAGLQGSYYRLLEMCGTAIVHILQVFTTAPRVVAIGGLDNADAVESFKGSDIGAIDRVVVDVGSSMLRSTEGRYAIGEMFYNKEDITPDEFMELMNTGTLGQKFKRAAGQRSIIAQENDALGMGPPTTMAMGPMGPVKFVQGVRAIKTDDHPLHIQEHTTELDSPLARENPAVLDAIFTHIDEHFTTWRNMDPSLALVLGLPPPPGVTGAAPAPDGSGAQPQPAGAQQEAKRPTGPQKPEPPGAPKPNTGRPVASPIPSQPKQPSPAEPPGQE